MDSITDIPGYREAVQAEADARDLAFLDLTESICGIDVRPLTSAHVLMLVGSGNPLVIGGRLPKFPDVALFLWAVSPSFKPCSKARHKFLKSIRHLDFDTTRDAIDKYID